MARALRAAPLSLKLDVIVEEGSNANMNSTHHSYEATIQSRSSAASNATCTLTIRSAEQTLGNEPQFLHSGKWPTMDMYEEAVSLAAEAKHIDTPAKEGSSILSSDQDPHDYSISTNADTDTYIWSIVTIDQLSMAMDHWDPDENTYPSPKGMVDMDALFLNALPTVHTIQQSIFQREIMDEYLTRMQTIEHIQELEDNDNAVEIVAILEGYRQNGWADEMIKAFPRQCWFFWADSGLASVARMEDHVCNEGDYIFSPK